MNAIKWISVGMMTAGASLAVVSLILRMRDRDELIGRFNQFLPTGG